MQGKTLNLLLGPPSWVKQQKFDVKSGATLEMTGVPGYKANGNPALLVRQIKAGKQTLTLRRPTAIRCGRRRAQRRASACGRAGSGFAAGCQMTLAASGGACGRPPAPMAAAR